MTTSERHVRLAAGLVSLAVLCACDVARFLPGSPPAPVPPVPPPTSAPVPVVTAPPPTPTSIPPMLPLPIGGQLPLPTVVPPMPGQSLLSTRQPDYTSLATPQMGAIDASGALVQGWAENRTSEVHGELVQSLFADQRARIDEIPFHVVNDRSEPNAAAGCSESHAPMLMMTSAMVVVCASSAEARAYDELAGTNTLEAYANALIEDLRASRPVRPLDRSLVPGPMANDPRKLAREVQLFDEQVAFILGHELAHHYRGHTGCAATGTTTSSARDAEQLQRNLANAASPLEQPFEVEADVWGITNVLERGRQRTGGAWTDEGALLSLEVFRHFGPLASGGLDPGVFLSTHPPSELRAPVVSQAALLYRPGQPPLPIPTLDGQGVSIDLGGGAPIRLPFPLPIAPR
ncbi:MAG: hypothetical protein J0L92_41130 [Deltaproteobacteria bacterium]|nr:hypothetical protein [Deltaproteobacteria bacterium]